VTGRCKGLLELRQTEISKSGSTVAIEQVVNLVVFTHRSIPEYLDDFLRRTQSNHVRNFDSIDALIQTLIAVFNTLPLDPLWLEDTIGTNLNFLVYEIRESLTKDKTPYFKSLELLDSLCHERQLEVHPDFDEVRWKKYIPSFLGRHASQKIFYEIIHVAISFSFYEYTSWKFLQSPDLLDDGPWLLMSAFLPWLWDDSEGLTEFIEDTSFHRATASLR
jgi:hypothetical protein